MRSQEWFQGACIASLRSPKRQFSLSKSCMQSSIERIASSLKSELAFCDGIFASPLPTFMHALARAARISPGLLGKTLDMADVERAIEKGSNCEKPRTLQFGPLFDRRPTGARPN